jgi:hypothetical protein
MEISPVLCSKWIVTPNLQIHWRSTSPETQIYISSFRVDWNISDASECSMCEASVSLQWYRLLYLIYELILSWAKVKWFSLLFYTIYSRIHTELDRFCSIGGWNKWKVVRIHSRESIIQSLQHKVSVFSTRNISYIQSPL